LDFFWIEWTLKVLKSEEEAITIFNRFPIKTLWSEIALNSADASHSHIEFREIARNENSQLRASKFPCFGNPITAISFYTHNLNLVF